MTEEEYHNLVFNDGELEKYLKQGGDPTHDNNYAIRFASNNNEIEVVKLLLKDSRVDPCASDNQAFRRAYRYKHYDIVKLLLDVPEVIKLETPFSSSHEFLSYFRTLNKTYSELSEEEKIYIKLKYDI